VNHDEAYQHLLAYFQAHLAADKALTMLAFANAMAKANRAKAVLVASRVGVNSDPSEVDGP
jgi:hypothetical protein